MRRIWTIIGVRDVRSSFAWYQSLLGVPPTVPAHDDFGQIVDADGTVLLCLHEWGAHEHPSLTSPARAQPGNGLLLFFRVDGFETAFTGWGLEDSDIVIRMIRAGVRRKDGRFATGVLHLWHPEADRSRFAANKTQLAELITSDRVRAVSGLSALTHERAAAV